MTAEEKKAYNNGFILGMASKGVIQKTIIKGGIEMTLDFLKHNKLTSVQVPSMTLDYIPLEVWYERNN